MSAPVKSRLTKIKRLYGQVAGYVQKTVQAVVVIGEELDAQKKSSGHGAWMEWAKELPFSISTAENYMRLWRNREAPQIHNVTNLGEAYRLLAKATEEPRTTKPEVRETPPETAEFVELKPNPRVLDLGKGIAQMVEAGPVETPVAAVDPETEKPVVIEGLPKGAAEILGISKTRVPLAEIQRVRAALEGRTGQTTTLDLIQELVRPVIRALEVAQRGIGNIVGAGTAQSISSLWEGIEAMHEQLKSWLPGNMIECPDCHGKRGEFVCPNCKGIGLVGKYKGMAS